MTFDRLLNHELVVRRAATDGTLDDYGQPVTAPVTVATVRGSLQPRSVRELALAAQSGAELGSHVAFLRPLPGLASDCWIELDGRRYDIVGIRDAGGRGHHLEVDLRSVG